MTTEEKNALAKEYAKQNAAPFNYKLYTENFDTPEMLETAFEAGLDARYKEVSDLVEALREARLQIEYLHGKFSPTGSGNNVLSRIDSLLSKYPVNNLPNG